MFLYQQILDCVTVYKDQLDPIFHLSTILIKYLLDTILELIVVNIIELTEKGVNE